MDCFQDEQRALENRIEAERAAQVEYEAYCAAYERDYWHAWGWFCSLFQDTPE